MTRTAKAPRGADYMVSYIFPQGTDITGYTGTFTIYTQQNGTSLLVVTQTPNPNGSSLSFDANIISVDIKNADIIALPTDATDSENPSVLFANFIVLTSAGDLVKVDGGAFVVYPYGASPVQNWGDLNVLINGQDITVEIAATGFDTSVLNTVNDAAAAAALSAYNADARADAAQVSAYNAEQAEQAVEELLANAALGPFVSYMFPQSLSVTQQAQARTNIDAAKNYNIPTTTVDYVASVAAFQATTTSSVAYQANTSQKPLFFPNGSATGGTNAVIAQTGAAQTVHGEGRGSTLQTTGIDMTDFFTGEVRDIYLAGAGDYGIRRRGLTQRNNMPNVSNVLIEGKTTGIVTDSLNQTTAFVAYSQTSNVTVRSCGTGEAVTNALNLDYTGVQYISNTVSDFTYAGGGELKIVQGRFQGGGSGPAFTITGVAGVPTVESYFVNCNFNQGGLTGGIVITEIAPYAAGAQIRVTTATPHKCVPGWGKVNLTSANYSSSVTWVVADVLSTTQMVLQVGAAAQAPGTYTLTDTSGTFNRQQPGLYMNSDAAGNINDMFLTNCAANNHEIKNVFNAGGVNRGGLAKEMLWLDGTNNRIFSMGSLRGRNGLNPYADILPGGPAAYTGWSHIGIFDETGTKAPGGVRTGSISPMKDWGLGVNNMAAGYAINASDETGITFSITTNAGYLAGAFDQYWKFRRPTSGDRMYLDATTSARITSGNKVNGLEIIGADATARPQIGTYGSDANIPMGYVAKGTGSHDFFTGATPARQFRVTDTVGAVDYVAATGGTGTGTMIATGTSTDIDAAWRAKGAGVVILRTGGTTWLTVAGATGITTLSAAGTDTNSDVAINAKGTGSILIGSNLANYVTAKGATAASAPRESVAGSDTNIDFERYTKGTGAHKFLTGATPSQQFGITDTAGATSYPVVTGAAAYGLVTVGGSDTNAALRLQSKGTGAIDFYTGATPALQFKVFDVAGATDYVQVFGSVAGSASVGAWGASTNIHMDIRSKGTNYVRLRGGTSGTVQFAVNDTGISFYGGTPVAKPSITGAKGGNAALTSLLTQLASLGILTDSTT